jgi:hypothetical protein
MERGRSWTDFQLNVTNEPLSGMANRLPVESSPRSERFGEDVGNQLDSIGYAEHETRSLAKALRLRAGLQVEFKRKPLYCGKTEKGMGFEVCGLEQFSVKCDR